MRPLEALLIRPTGSGESQTVARLFTPSLNLRAVTIEGQPWFVAPDVCRVLGMDLTREAGKWLAGLDKDELSTPEMLGVKVPGKGMSSVTFINESGLYALVLKSRKPEAQAFRKWVTSVVLPAIRKDGPAPLSHQAYGHRLPRLHNSEPHRCPDAPALPWLCHFHLRTPMTTTRNQPVPWERA